MRRITTVAISLLLLGGLAACGDDDSSAAPPADGGSGEEGEAPETDGSAGDGDAGTDTDDASGDADADESGGDAAAPSNGAGGGGTVTVEGTAHALDEAMNCEPGDAGIASQETHLAVSAFGDDGNVAVHVYDRTMGGNDSQSVDFYGPDGIFGGSATNIGGNWSGGGDVSYSEAPLEIGDGRITGAITVTNTMATDESVEIEIDVTYPDEATSC